MFCFCFFFLIYPCSPPIAILILVFSLLRYSSVFSETCYMEDQCQPPAAEPKASKRPREAQASQPLVAELAKPKQLAPVSKARAIERAEVRRQVEALMAPSPKFSAMPSRGTGSIRVLAPAEMDTSSETSENVDMEAESEESENVDMEAESESTAGRRHGPKGVCMPRIRQGLAPSYDQMSAC